jgi:thioredoxin 1
MIICIGPVCIPVYSLLPFLFALLLRAKDYLLELFGLRPAGAKPAASVAPARESLQPNRANKLVEPSTREAFLAALQSKPVAFVDFGATWCGPCKRIAPVFAEECLLHGGAATFIKVDVDELDGVAAQYKVSGVPAFIVFKDGVEVDRQVGADEANLRALIARYA